MKLFKLIGWGQPALGCVICCKGVGEGKASIAANVGGPVYSLGKETFCKLRLKQESNLGLGNAAGSLGGRRSYVWLSAYLSSGFSWAQCSGIRVEAFTLKTLFLKRSDNVLVKLLLFHFQCSSSWT